MKQWPKLVAIIDGVRELGHDVGLTLVGNRNDDLLLRELRDMQTDGRPWLELKLNLPRTEVDRLIGSHTYGIHGMHFEHYGMAVAELVLGGCLTFVHDSGGQVEIVCQQEARYRDVEDAVAKLHLVLSSPEKQAALISAQQKRRVDITRERFLSEFHRLMDDLEQGHLEAVNLEP
jgi:glycosyltransferase involved in cell wall biosynthesis